MSFQIGKDCIIDETATINVIHGRIGPRTIIRAGAIIEGYHVEIGAESYLDIRARIGGGSCWERDSYLVAGEWLHMGVDSHINTARPVEIGYEVGLGVGTKIFTHGAYLSALNGYPTQWDRVWIGKHVWLPHAWVNPGVRIGHCVVVAAMSLVNRNLPFGCLAGGIPVKILKKKKYPRQLSKFEWDEIASKIFIQAQADYGDHIGTQFIKPGCFETSEGTIFDLKGRHISGKVTQFSEIFKNQLRRNGIRFRYYAKDGEYVPWETS